jgi:hypothetical protein
MRLLMNALNETLLQARTGQSAHLIAGSGGLMCDFAFMSAQHEPVIEGLLRWDRGVLSDRHSYPSLLAT